MSLRQVWLSFFVSCVAALILLGTMWFFQQSHAANELLSWLVLVVPVLLGVVVIAVPAKHEDERSHMRWRYILGLALIVYGGLAWVQQSRATNESLEDREKAIRDTAAQTSAEVSKTVGQQYEAMISDLNIQIEDLKKQLSMQAKDFAEQLKQTDTDLSGSISRVGTTPIKYAQLQFSLWGEVAANQLPILDESILPDSDGTISVDFTVTNISDTAADSVDMWVYICDRCVFASEPSGFDKPSGMRDVERHKMFASLNPGVSLEKMTVKIKFPPFSAGTQFVNTELDLKYSCATCGKMSGDIQRLKIRSMRPIQLFRP